MPSLANPPTDAARPPGRRPALAIFDIDGTLVAGPSTEKRFFLALAAAGRLGPRQLAAFAGFVPRYARRFGAQVFKKNKAYLAGKRPAEIGRFARRWIGDGAAVAWNVPCLRRLRRHLAAGDRVVLLSGTPQPVAEALAECLGADAAIGTACTVRAGCFTAAPPERHPFGAAKRALAEALCREQGIEASRVVAYADSIHDLPLLEWAGEAVAVCPDRRLRAAAAARGFEVLDAEPGAGQRQGRPGVLGG